jgi:hypothetical protein
MDTRLLEIFGGCAQLRLITIADRTKDAHPSHKKMGYPGNRAKLISDTYFTVKMIGKNEEPCFFILASLKKEPHRGWFRKGVHIHVQTINTDDDLYKVIHFMLSKNLKWTQYENYQLVVDRYNRKI